jgi:hypothetical protein
VADVPSGLHLPTMRIKRNLEAFMSSVCKVVHCSFYVFFIGPYMFPPNWPSSGAQVVMFKDSAAHYNAVIFPPTVVA